MNYTVKTWVNGEGKIYQAWVDPTGCSRYQSVTDVATAALDAAIRLELIRLGWTPPPQEAQASSKPELPARSQR